MTMRGINDVAAPVHQVYLAGPITGLSFGEATSWRDWAKLQLAAVGVLGLSPLRYKDYLKDESSLQDVYANHVLSTQKGITTRDRWDCQRSEVVWVNLLGAERVSIGTCIEFGWADAARVPIVTTMEPENIHDHAMVREVSGYIIPTIEESFATVRALLGV